jgi:outer membrane protein assembly factor BamA
VEEAGGLLGSFGSDNSLYRFIKFEAEFRHSTKIRKSNLSYRFFAGLGYNYGKDTLRDHTLPFFKQFYAGGPYSMRAWGLRQLGLGSSTLYDSDTALSTYRDRFGDMQLEANLEYRFPIITLAGVKIGSALFTDIGNIWNIKKNPGDPTGVFQFNNLYRDLAVGVGTGIRVDFTYFLIRLDWAYKVKDPARQYNNGWMDQFQWFENRPNGLKVTNYAFQLGIGLPF